MLKKGLAIFLTILLTACEGPTGPNGKDGIDGENGGYDKQIRITFPFEYWGTDSFQWQLGDAYTYLTKFNKTSFVNVDSIIFVVPMTSDWGNDTTTDTSYVELYNVTNSSPIAGSQLSIISGSYQLLETNNIYSNLPANEITISIRMRRSDSSGWCYVRTPQLIMYRK